MLTDIFAERYKKYPIFSAYTDSERKLLTQTIGLAKEVFPHYDNEGKIHKPNQEKWKSIHNRLARELGLTALAQTWYSYTTKGYDGKDWPVSGSYSWDVVCEQFVTQIPPPPNKPFEPDGFVKERLSLIELIMRLRDEEVVAANGGLANLILTAKQRDSRANLGGGMRVPGSSVDAVKHINSKMNAIFATQVEELNERFRRAGAPLTYHNGFIQVSVDPLIEENIATPFWALVADPTWKNVDLDMKEALDRRDSNDKDPAIFAARALESAIKIVSTTKGWNTGKENGAANFIDNLVSKANGGFLAVWEGDILRDYFKKVRNPLGHGAGVDPMHNLSPEQTDWAIETAMSWVRTIVRRM